MNFSVRLLLLGLVATTSLRSQSSCALQSALEQIPTYESRAGVATLQGFSEFTAASIPPKKYKAKILSGAVTTAVFTDAACTVPHLSYDIGTSDWVALSYADNPPSVTNASGRYRLNGGLSITVETGGYTANGGSSEGLSHSSYALNGGSFSGWLSDDAGGVTFSVTPSTVSVSFKAWNWWYQATTGVANISVSVSSNHITENLTYSGASYIEPATGMQTNAGAVNGQIFNASTQVPSNIEASSLATVDDAISRLGSGLFGTPALTPTTRTLISSGNGVKIGTASFWRKITATNAVDTLSAPDTEDAAVTRAQAASVPGTSSIAYRETRGAGDFDFGFNGFTAKADFKTCPGEHLITYHYAKRVRGTQAWTEYEEYEQKRFEKEVETVEREVPVPAEGDPYEYTITKITATKTSCDVATAGSGFHDVASVHSMLTLGRMNASHGAGMLLLRKSVIDSSIYTPAALEYVGPETSAVEVVRDDADDLRQVKASDVLADIVKLESPEEGYTVAFYHSNQVGVADPVTGVYAVTGSPFVTHRFDNPDVGQVALAKHLRVTETKGATSKVFIYSYDANNAVWGLSKGSGLQVTEEVTTTDGNNDTVKTRTQKTQAGEVSSVVATTYHTFPWGKEKTKEVLDPAGAALTTTWTYYDNETTDGANYRRVKLRSDASGHWERYTYDLAGHVASKASPFLDSAPTATDAQCRVTLTTTDAVLADVDGDGLNEKLTTVIDTTLGQETGRSYQIEWSKPVTLGAESFERRSDIRCVAAGSAWNAAGNLVTETLSYASGTFSGRTRRIVNPDGTASLTTYSMDANGVQTTVQSSGAPNGALDAIIDGMRTTTTTNAQGYEAEALVEDIASGLTLDHWVVTESDAFGRPTRMDYTDGTYETRDYACCGLSDSRDRHGRITQYNYDALGRQEYVTQNGLTSHTAYDADGRVRSVTRIGDDASQVVLEINKYDLAGRLYEHRDALNRPTFTTETYDATTGQNTRLTTNPDGGTVIEISARDGSRLSTGGTAAAQRSYDYGFESGQLYTKETLLGDAGETTEWTKTYTDFAGRTSRISYADGAAIQTFYNAVGQRVRQVDADNVTTLFAYNARGEQTVSAVDVNANNLIDYTGFDRIVRTTTTVATKTVAGSSYTVHRSTTEAWEDDNLDAATTASISEQTTNGLRTWRTSKGLSASTVTTYDALGGRVVVTTAPDATVTTQTYVGDLLMSHAVTHPTLGTLRSASYGYDAHHRLETATDTRNGTTNYTYFDDDQIKTLTTPDPDTARSGPGYDRQVTTYHYNDVGRPDDITQPDGTHTYTTYWPTGQVKRTWGSRTYPTEYTYDAQLRVKTLTTWKDFASEAGAAVTTWNYHPQRGWLLNKRYADLTGPGYTYKSSGRLLTRTWARQANGQSLVTTYGYTAAGDLNSIDYSDADTPDVSITTFDRLGRPTTMTDGAGTRSLTYSTFGQGEDEAYTAGPLNGLTLDRTYDGYARLQTLSVPSIYTAGYGYDAASRLDTVTEGVRTAKYAYVPNSPLVESVTVKNNGTLRLTTTKGYDYLNRLGSIANTPAATPAHTVGYDYNAANQRTRATREDTTFWDYSYDALGQVTSAGKKQAGGNGIPGHAYAFLFDDIGNRKTSGFNGTTTTYTPNDLNQYDERTVPGVIEVLGDANSAATITYTIGSGLPQPVTRQGGLFHAQAMVDNSTAPVTTALTVTGVKNDAGPADEDAVTAFTRTVFTPQTPEAYDYDTDGNLTADALWSYAWDAENRLKSMETSASALTAGRPRVKYEYAYDGQGRRFAKKAYAWTSGAWVLTASRLFVYDGWNLLAEFDALAANAVVRTYVWGLDLSGSLQGAGGVGGLLWLNAGTATHATGYDGNGNVIALVDLADGSNSATYDYGPFGETLKADGPAAALNPYRFSTKFTDETGLLYYGFRYYNPSTGRWLSKDPLGERGGLNLYGFVQNAPTRYVDKLGLLLAAVDGTGSWTWRRFDRKSGRWNSHVRNFYMDYIGPGPKQYWDGPAKATTGSDSPDIHKDVIKWICGVLKNNPSEPINIIGHSRGGYIAMQIAKELKEKGCACISGGVSGPVRVNFMGLYDPVDMVVGYGDGQEVTSNVDYAANALGDPQVNSRPYFNTSDGGAEDASQMKSYDEKTFDATHGGMGGDPWGGDHPEGMTEARDQAGSSAADAWMRDRARNAGIQLR